MIGAKNESENQSIGKPVAIVGAGELTAFLFRQNGASFNAYEFNLIRIGRNDGASTQLFQSRDIKHVIKVCHLIAFAVLDDGWIDNESRSEIRHLIQQLEKLIATWETGDE